MTSPDAWAFLANAAAKVINAQATLYVNAPQAFVAEVAKGLDSDGAMLIEALEDELNRVASADARGPTPID